MSNRWNRIDKRKTFRKFHIYWLNLNFKQISTLDEGAEIKFLDIHYKINKEEKNFKTTNYIKPTATFAKLLNRNCHPPHVSRGISLGEANGLKKLNENEKDYINEIKKLESKCRTSNFKKSITNKNFK